VTTATEPHPTSPELTEQHIRTLLRLTSRDVAVHTDTFQPGTCVGCDRPEPHHAELVLHVLHNPDPTAGDAPLTDDERPTCLHALLAHIADARTTADLEAMWVELPR
jgi:hypothetical protein